MLAGNSSHSPDPSLNLFNETLIDEKLVKIEVFLEFCDFQIKFNERILALSNFRPAYIISICSKELWKIFVAGVR